MIKTEFSLKNYLDKHGIYKGDSDMQTIIINSFYNEHNKKAASANDEEWKEKLLYVQKHFGSFAQYANNNWKEKP